MLAGTNDARAFVYENAAGDLEGMLELSLRSAAEERSGSPVPFIEAWYVREQARGRGVGRALVDAAQRWARAHGFGKTASEARCRFGGG
jgi:aminoglycoside 6'-N-acetyltransferase I